VPQHPSLSRTPYNKEIVAEKHDRADDCRDVCLELGRPGRVPSLAPEIVYGGEFVGQNVYEFINFHGRGFYPAPPFGATGMQFDSLDDI
jgi:hypothetical protein